MLKTKVLMGVYNEIDFDGRVQRAAEALGESMDVTLCSVDAFSNYHNPAFSLRRFRPIKSKVFRPLALMLFWAWFALIALRIRPRVIYAHDFYLAFPGWVASKLTSASFVYDAHELLVPDQGQVLSRRAQFFYCLEKWVVKRADLLIAANLERAEIMKEHYRLAKLPQVIRNIPPQPHVPTSSPAILSRFPELERRYPERVRLVYQGDMTLERGLGVFLEVMEFLPEYYELLLVGGGPDLGRIKERFASQTSPSRVIVLGRVPRSELHDVLSTGDIGIITYPGTGLNNIYCAPNKVYEYAQAGLPMLATAHPPLRRMFEEYQIGRILDYMDPTQPSDPRTIAATIQSVGDNLSRYRREIPKFLMENTWENERFRLENAMFAYVEVS
jgi:Glycosyl transferases group 1.